MEAKLKKGALGYKSKEVEAYLVEMSNKYADDVKTKDKTIAELERRIAGLEEKIDGYEAERLSVADALVKAQKEAQDIMDAAVTEAGVERDKIKTECEKFTAKITDAKATLAALQADALKVIDEYRVIIEKFTDFDDAEDDN